MFLYVEILWLVYLTVDTNTSCIDIYHEVGLIWFNIQFISGDSAIYDVKFDSTSFNVFVIRYLPMSLEVWNINRQNILS